MNTFGKVALVAVVTLAVIGLGFLVDAKVFDRGEENRAPSVGIKAAAVEPKFVTVNSQPLVSVYVKGEAAWVWVEVAPRIDPTTGGETLATYDLEAYETLPASKLNPEDTGEVRHWAAIIPVPASEGQYLLTAHAADSEGRETKFKMFNTILAVQPVREQLAGDTPGQSTILKFVDFINSGNLDEAAELLTPDLRAKTGPENLLGASGDKIEVTRLDLQNLSLAEAREVDRVELKLTGDGGELAPTLTAEFVPNPDQPLSKWQINKIEK